MSNPEPSGDSSVEKVAQSPDWPTPSFDRAGTMYECSDCGTVVNPKAGDKECGLSIAGATYKLCSDCSSAIREGFQ
jgi:DNA-directed RNA polymerase subunit RPC12/RpoP